jgi:hypothetical protein
MFLIAIVEDKLKTVPEQFDRDSAEVQYANPGLFLT